MSGARRLTDDAIRDALAVSARAKPRPDLDSAIARAIRTTRQDQPPLARRLGLSPRLSLPGLRVVRIGFLLADLCGRETVVISPCGCIRRRHCLVNPSPTRPSSPSSPPTGD